MLPACSVLRTSRGIPPRFSFRTAEVTEPGSGGAYDPSASAAAACPRLQLWAEAFPKRCVSRGSPFDSTKNIVIRFGISYFAEGNERQKCFFFRSRKSLNHSC